MNQLGTPITAIRSRDLVLAGIFVALTLLILLLMGRVPICTCGSVKLWFGSVTSDETSQHLTDWYTLSHIIHGFIFYAAAWFAFRNWSVGSRLLLATLVEAGWEILENTSIIIDRYREQTVSLNYYGDSVINSFGDILAMFVGFFAASRLPVWASVAICLFFELLAAYVIRDNLTLNIVMLLWPNEFIKNWQRGV
jgi:hypothetical protein